jgi:hypothetical protein
MLLDPGSEEDGAAESRMRRHARTKAALVVVGLYAASMILPAYHSPLRGSVVTHPGHDAFQIGWKCAMAYDQPGWDLFAVMMCGAWSANPCIWSAVFCLSAGFTRLAAAYAGIALCLQLLTAIYFGGLVCDCSGFWCWVGCSAWLLVVCCRMARRRS